MTNVGSALDTLQAALFHTAHTCVRDNRNQRVEHNSMQPQLLFMALPSLLRFAGCKFTQRGTGMKKAEQLTVLRRRPRETSQESGIYRVRQAVVCVKSRYRRNL